MDTNNNQFPDEQQEPAPTYAAPTTPAQPSVAPQPTYTPPVATPKSRKNLMWTLPLALLAIAGLVAAGYYLGTQQGDDKQANTATTSDSIELRDTKEQDKDDVVAEPVDSYAGWQSSADIALGGPAPTFSFKYPGSWKHVKPGEGASCGITVSPTATTWTRTDSTVNACGEGRSARTLLSAAGGYFRDIPVASAQSLTVKGRDAVQVESKPQTEGQQTVIQLVTAIDDVKLPGTYQDLENGVRVMTDIGYLYISGEYRGESAGFEAFKKDYQMIVNSIEVK